jgi:ATP-binding cassette subfamily B (MDR/TAP) protein 1
VTLDGVDIKDLNVRWLRSQIGYVGQEPVLFAGTVAENIACALPTDLPGKRYQPVRPSFLSKHGSAMCYCGVLAGDKPYAEQRVLRERVVAAAKLANAHDFISCFPEGYDTDVGNNGSGMSGGK